MTKFRIKLITNSVDKEAFRRACEKQSRVGDNSSVVHIDNKEHHHLFFDVLNMSGERVGCMLFDERQDDLVVDIQEDYMTDTVKVDVKPIYKFNNGFTNSRQYRLEVVERELKKLQDEVSCIRRGD